MRITRDEYSRGRHLGDAGSELLFGSIRSDRRGRPSRHPRILLTGIILSIDSRGSATITDVHDVLTTELDIEDQWDLGVRTRTKTGEVRILTLADLYNMTRTISKKLDHTKIRARGLSDEGRYARRDALDEIAEAIIMASHIERPDGSNDFAVDGTGVWDAQKGLPDASLPAEKDGHDEESGAGGAGAAPKEPDPHVSADSHERTTSEDVRDLEGAKLRRPSDASWGWKTAKSGGREPYFGYDVEILVRVPTVGAPRSEPALAEAMVVLPASTDIVEPVLAIFDRLKARGVSIGKVLADRHYSFKRFDRWFSGLLKRGIRQVVDLHSADQGFRDWDGMQMAAGWAHCPFTPRELGTIPSPSPRATEAERADFERRIAQRQAYAAQRTGRMNVDGKVRFRCPALNGTVGCPRREGTEAAALTLGLPLIKPSDDVMPRLCTQETVQIEVKTPTQAVAMKVHQDHYWGSDPWRKDYARRTYVEGFFGVLKNESGTGHSRGTHQFIGLPMVTLVLACSVAVTNMRLLRSWHAETGLGPEDHELLKADQEFHGFRQLTKEEADALDSPHLAETDAA